MYTLQISSTFRDEKVVYFKLTIFGITASILSKGRTSKNGIELPFKPIDSSTCNIRNESNHAVNDEDQILNKLRYRSLDSKYLYFFKKKKIERVLWKTIVSEWCF